MEVTPLPMVTLTRLEQLKKASVPMEVTLFGMVMLTRLEHPLKRVVSMEVTPLPIVTLTRLEQLVKAPFPMEVTLFGMVTFNRLEQPVKALIPMEVMLLGMVMLTKLEHPLKAISMMSVTPSGMVACPSVMTAPILSPHPANVLWGAIRRSKQKSASGGRSAFIYLIRRLFFQIGIHSKAAIVKVFIVAKSCDPKVLTDK
jgi:hypothetical protein